MTKIEQLRADIEAKLAAKRAQFEENLEIAKLEGKLKSAELSFKFESMEATSKKLKDLEQTCETIVNAMPIYSNKTRENRKWNPSRQYGLGNHIQLLSGLLTGILYSAQEHKALMLAETGLSEELIESTVTAFGSPSYYSNNYSEIVPESPFDLATLVDNLDIIADRLDININTASVTEKVFNQRFELARIRAEKDAAEAQLTNQLSQQTIKVEG